MQFRKIVPFLMIFVIAITACSQAKPTTMSEMPAATAMPEAVMATQTPEAMMATVTPEMMMDTATPDTMMDHSGDMMDTATPDTMVNHSEDMMDTATPDAMMQETHPMTDTATPDTMMGQSGDMMETPTPDDMMGHSGDMMGTTTPEATMGTSSGAMSGESMMAPDWFSATLTDVPTQEMFTINDFKGKVVLVEPMAQWCPTCLAQQKQVAKLHELLGMNSDLVSLSLDIDPNEDSSGLQSYVAKNGFSWMFAVAPAAVSNEIGNLYGNQFLNPPSAPMFIIDRHGEVHTLPFGIKSAEDLQKAIEPYLTDMG